LLRFHLRVVQLLPTFSELARRFHERGPVLTQDELRMVYEEQGKYTQYDLRIDNTRLGPQEVAAQVGPLLWG
jgi:hypothetical protein